MVPRSSSRAPATAVRCAGRKHSGSVGCAYARRVTRPSSDSFNPLRLRGRLDALLERLAGIGALPTDDEETRLKKALTVLIAIVILPVAFTWATLYLAFGAWA